MFKKLSLISVCIVLMAGVFAVSAQEDEEGVRLVMDADDSVIPHGERNDWDGRFTVPAVVLDIDGELHMLRNGYPSWPAPNSVGYVISEDGATWIEVQEDPIFRHEEAPYGADMNLVTSAMRQDDGTWVFYLFLSSLDGITTDPTRPHGIARATAASPTDPWQFDEALVLLPGSEGEWDNGFIGPAEVFKLDEGYVMYYVGDSVPGGNAQIGMATSEDGINWEKYDNRATTDAPFAESDPIFTAQDNSTWEYGNISDISIIQHGDKWLMFYGSMNTSTGSSFSGYNLAFSEDGLTWERLSEEPLWTNKEIARRPTWTTDIIEYEGEILVWMEISRHYRGDTDIFMGRIEGLDEK